MNVSLDVCVCVGVFIILITFSYFNFVAFVSVGMCDNPQNHISNYN